MSEPTDTTELIEKDEIDFNHYWAINPQGLCWNHVLDRLTKGYKADGREYLLGVMPDNTIRWFLNKKVFTAAMLSKAFGIAEAKLTDKVTKIDLPALEKKERADQPRPTVPYYGEA